MTGTSRDSCMSDKRYRTRQGGRSGPGVLLVRSGGGVPPKAPCFQCFRNCDKIKNFSLCVCPCPGMRWRAGRQNTTAWRHGVMRSYFDDSDACLEAVPLERCIRSPEVRQALFQDDAGLIQDPADQILLKCLGERIVIAGDAYNSLRPAMASYCQVKASGIGQGVGPCPACLLFLHTQSATAFSCPPV